MKSFTQLRLVAAIAVVLVVALANTASAVTFYEDFATTGSQYTLVNNIQVAGGYLTGFDGFTGSWTDFAVLDGSFPASLDIPSNKTMTFNYLGAPDTWTAPYYMFGTDGGASESWGAGVPAGFYVSWFPLYLGGTMRLEWNQSVADGAGWAKPYEGAGVIPGGFDGSADYEFVIEDSGASVTFWVQDALDHNNRITPVTVDISGYARYGDQDILGIKWSSSTLGIDDVTIVPEPGSITLLVCGLLGLAFAGWRSNRKWRS